MVIMQCAILELYWHFCSMHKHSARDFVHINDLNHSKKEHTMDSFNKENEDSSLSFSESNHPQTTSLSEWHKLKALATGLWLGGSSDNSNNYLKYIDEAAKRNRQDGGAYCLHIQQSHSCHATWCSPIPSEPYLMPNLRSEIFKKLQTL